MPTARHESDDSSAVARLITRARLIKHTRRTRAWGAISRGRGWDFMGTTGLQ